MNCPLNKKRVKGLFEQKVILMSTEGQISYFRVAVLFGEDAVGYAHRMGTSRSEFFFNGYGIGDYIMGALTLHGFQAAASFYNVQLLRKGMPVLGEG